MDNANEQKWFVYIGDKHEGPFSVSDISQKIKEGTLTTEQYVWCEGMADWLPMLEVPDFKSLGSAPAAKPVPAASAKSTATKSATTSTTKKTATKQSVTLKGGGSGLRSRMKVLLGLFLIVALGGVAFSLGLIEKSSQDKLIASVMNLAEPALDFLSEKVPAISSYLSPIPPIEDVKPDDLKAMKATAKTNPEAGLQFYVALKTGNLIKPTLVIATNLPDGAVLDVFFSGNPARLLNTLSYSLKKPAIVQNKIAVISNIADPTGSPIPRGEYKLSITDVKPELQPAPVKSLLATLPKASAVFIQGIGGSETDIRKIAFTKKIFLGGSDDANFAEKIKTYHEELTKKSTKEVGEVKMYFDSLVSQFNLTNNQFSELKKQKNPKSRRKLWDPFHQKWEKFGIQLLQTFQSWSPPVLEKDFIQGRLYMILQETGAKVIKHHQTQDKIAKKNLKISAEEDRELNEGLASAQNALSLLQSKLDQILKEPSTPEGLPRRVE